MFWTFIRRFSIIVLLTIVTQVGGIVYLLYLPLGRQLRNRIKKKWPQRLLRLSAFGLLMLISSLFIVPMLAKQFGRVPLPVLSSESHNLVPGSYFFVIANRHYVTPELRNVAIDASNQLKRDYPEAKLLYLDGCFPFITGFPLLPHLSHNDGRKLDLAFVYQKTETKRFQNKLPTLLGYGFFEGPKQGENNAPAKCADGGYWQYGLLGKFALDHPNFTFNESANTCLLKALARDKRVGKIFIEPHLKTRLQLTQFNKIRFHGCRAVRHDDHIHLQL